MGSGLESSFQARLKETLIEEDTAVEGRMHSNLRDWPARLLQKD